MDQINLVNAKYIRGKPRYASCANSNPSPRVHAAAVYLVHSEESNTFINYKNNVNFITGSLSIYKTSTKFLNQTN